VPQQPSGPPDCDQPRLKGKAISSSTESRAQVFRSLGHNLNVLRIVAAYCLYAVCEFGLWIAVLVYAYAEGGAATAGIVAVAQLVPSAGVALLVAPLAERRSPVATLVGGFAVQCVGATVTAALILSDAPSLFVYAGAVVTSSAMSTTRPSQSALLPALTSELDQLMAANVLIGWVENLAILISGIAVGIALTFGNAGHAFAGAAVLQLLALLLVAPLLRLSLARRAEPTAADTEKRESEFALVWKDRPARLLLGLIGLEHVVVGALDLLFVVMALDVLDAGEEWAGYFNTAYGAGAVVLGALTALLVGRRLGPVVVTSAVVLGLALSGGTVANLPAVVLLFAVVGGSRTLFDVAVKVLLQRSVSPHRLARIFGFAEGLSMLGLAAGSVLVPVLVALGGANLALVGTAVLLPLTVLVRLRMLLAIDQHARVPVVEIALLQQIPIFRVLPGPEIEALAQSLERVTFEPGDVLMREGEQGLNYYAIADGTVEVSQGGQRIRELGRADGLGEIALLRSVPRTATAVATSQVTSYELDRDSFLTAVTGHSPTLESVHTVVREHEARDARRGAPPSS
jgi:MFS family permease